MTSVVFNKQDHIENGSALAERAEYIDDLWFLLHHSEDDAALMLGLTSYLDDSGSDDGSPLVVCGGLLMSRIQFKAFSERWDRMYGEERKFTGLVLEPPLHMTDFIYPGKYCAMYPELKRAFFRRVVRLINDHKFYSISVALSQADFQNELTQEARKTLIGPYGYAFFSLVCANRAMSELRSTGPVTVSYLVDCGFSFKEQLIEAHELIVRFQTAFGEFRHAGALAMDSDDRVPALQAADAIAWTSRRIETKKGLPDGFEPLVELLREDLLPPHAAIQIPRDAIRMFSEPVNSWVSKYGEIPKLTDILAREMNGFLVKLKSK